MFDNEIIIVELKKMEELAGELEIAVEMLHFCNNEFSLDEVNKILDNLTSALAILTEVANRKKEFKKTDLSLSGGQHAEVG